MRYHLRLVTMVIIKKSTNNTCWKCVEKGTPHTHCWWEWKLMRSLYRTVGRFFKKLKIEVSYDSVIPLIYIYIYIYIYISRGNSNLKSCRHPNVHSSTIYNSQDTEATWVSMAYEWIKKMWYIYTMGYYWVIKKNEIMPVAATSMNLEVIILSEVSQAKTNVTWYCLCEKSKKRYKWIYLQNRNKLT